MRCPQCQFENVPGQERCLRCHAILQAAAAIGTVNPPRMAHWKRPVRMMSRWLRLRKVMPEMPVLPQSLAFPKIMSKSAFLGLVLSIIPGFAHFIDGRFREVRWFVLGWLLTLIAGILFYGSNIGLLLLGLAVGLHSWIAFNHTLSKEQEDPSKRFLFLLALLVLAGLLYWGIISAAFRGFAFGYTNLTIPYQNVRSGDLLLARRNLTQADDLQRGALVLAPIRQVGGHTRVSRRFQLVVGQIVGLPGDKIEIAQNCYIVNGQVLDADKFPLPQWLSKYEFRNIDVPDDSCFVSNEYNIRGNAYRWLTADMVKNACLVRSSEIEAKAVMLWIPLNRRGFLRANE